MMRRYLLGIVFYLLARIRYLYAIAAAVFGISTTFMLYYRPKSVWGRWYLIVTIIMLILCLDATLKARNAAKAMKAAGEADGSHDGSDDDGGAETDANADGDESESAGDDAADEPMIADAAMEDTGCGTASGGGSADIPQHGSEKQATENENGARSAAEDAVCEVHHPQE